MADARSSTGAPERATVDVAVVVDYYYPATGGGGVPRGVRSLMCDPGVTGVIVTTDHDLGSRTPHPVATRRIEECGAPIDYVPRRALRLWHRIVRRSPDVVLLTSPFSRRTIRVLLGRRIATLARRGGMPAVVLWSQGEMGERALADKPRRKRWFLAAGRALGLFDGVTWFVVDRREIPAVERFAGVTPAHVPYGLPVAAPALPRPVKRAGTLDVVFVGRIVERKGVLLVIRALRHVDGRVRFTVVGPEEDAAYVARCRRAASDLPSSIEVRFVGPVDHDRTAAIFAAHHASVLVSDYESFGFAVFESLDQGCVPVVSRATAFDFDGTDAGLHADLTVDSVRAALQTLVDDDDPALRRRSDAARALAAGMRAADRHASTLASRLAALAPPAATPPATPPINGATTATR